MVDEELKMMARICEDGGRVLGPYLKEMAHLAHTEYFIEGQTSRDVREVLRETLFAPTVTGSPLESACLMIRRYEPQGRGYYSGAALIGGDGQGGRTLDSAILIRTAEIEGDGRLRIGVGSTIVRHSDPLGEAAESRAKASGLKSQVPQRLARTGGAGQPQRADRRLLAARRQRAPAVAGRPVRTRGADRRCRGHLHLDDRQAAQVAGPDGDRRGFPEPYSFDGYDLVIMGPGPGNHRDRPAEDRPPAPGHPFAAQRAPAVPRRVPEPRGAEPMPGPDLQRRQEPNQGVQKQIDLFGAAERVGFYSTFCRARPAGPHRHWKVGPIEISRDRETGEVHALRGPRFASMQFHPESVLTREGPRII
ncbi:chorismate-binding protein, partial [Pseudomonas aeruginosa]|uniref:chorismate-binding protein n=1 Tax=Pseudomonas aeruginosa TaxID=287 RepID=UPI003747F44E